MKLTWFGSGCFRVHSAGQIIVLNPADAPGGISTTELLGGADVVCDLTRDLAKADGVVWRPRKTQRLLDAAATSRAPEVWQIGPYAAVLDTDGEAPLVFLEDVAPLGKWAEQAIIVCFGRQLGRVALEVLALHSPRLLVLAAEGGLLDATFDTLVPHLDDTGLLALETGLAVEV